MNSMRSAVRFKHLRTANSLWSEAAERPIHTDRVRCGSRVCARPTEVNPTRSRHSARGARYRWDRRSTAEKALEALLVTSSIPFKKTHDLVVLAGLQDVEVRAELAPIDLLVLHPWAVEARYPGDLPDASDDEAAEVVSTAASVFDIAARRIRPIEPEDR